MQLSLKEDTFPAKPAKPTTLPLHNYGFHPRFPTEDL